MKIKSPIDGTYFDAPTREEIEKKYFFPLQIIKDQGVICFCGWGGLRGELMHEIDIEQDHPKNRKNPNCNMMNRQACHYTAFEECPKCGRCLFADGRPTGLALVEPNNP